MRRLVTALLVPLVTIGSLAACSKKSEPEASPDVPKGFQVPSGVTLTDAGTTLAVGKTATVVYDPGGAASAVAVRIDSAKRGKIADFSFFSLDAETKKSTPYYVRATVRNAGPAGLGGASLPIYLHSSGDTIYPPNELVGTFKPCPDATLPRSFLAGKTAQICLVYLLPRGERLRSIDLQTGSQKDAIRFTP